MKNDTIILVGFMGSGKSTVGRIVADKLGFRFADSDRVIEQTLGMPIPDIFRERGEAAFRSVETETLKRLIAEGKRVIATGGGAVLSEENRKAMKEGGLVVALKAEPETIIRRVGAGADRPLLAGDVKGNVLRLFEQRKGAYDFADLIVDTDNMTPEQAALFIIDYLKKGNQ